MDDGTARVGVSEKNRRLRGGLRPGRRGGNLHPDQRTKRAHGKHRESVPTGADVISQKRMDRTPLTLLRPFASNCLTLPRNLAPTFGPSSGRNKVSFMDFLNHTVGG